MKKRALAAALLALACAPAAFADEEASNRAYVAASQYGNCYARSVPSSGYGTQGETVVYSVSTTSAPDTEIARFDWFAPQIRLECNVGNARGEVGLSVVQIGPWPRGHEANDETLALAFYWNGQLQRRYSTLDIARRADNVQASVSHYQVVQEYVGYQWRESNAYDFVVRTLDGRTLTFDAASGALRSSTQSQANVP